MLTNIYFFYYIVIVNLIIFLLLITNNFIFSFLKTYFDFKICIILIAFILNIFLSKNYKINIFIYLYILF